MSLIENHFKNVPDYYDWMYLDGYTPEEILYAFHRKMDREQAEREALNEGFDSIKVKSEVKLKRRMTRRKRSSPFWKKRFSA